MRRLALTMLIAALAVPTVASAQVAEQTETIPESRVQTVTVKCKPKPKRKGHKRPRCYRVTVTPQVPAVAEPERD